MVERDTWMRGVLSGAVVLTLSGPAAAIEYFSPPTNLVDNAANWTNYIRLADLDGDLDPDVIVPNCGGFFQNPSAQPFRIFRNDAGTFVDNTQGALGSPTVTLAVRVVAIGDVDGNGALDLYLPSANGGADRLYMNNGMGVFANQAATRLPANTNSNSAGARFGDVDGDGDLDLMVAQGYVTNDNPCARLYLNDGSGIFNQAVNQIPATCSGTDPDDVDFLDFDRDFDLDVIINAHAGKSTLWQNDGSGTFTDVTSQLPAPATNNFHYNPAACDVDGDDDLDLWIDNIGGSFREQLMLNDASGNFTDVTTAQVMMNPSADDNGVVCIDIDDDGDFDAAIPSLSNNERILLNNGSGTFTLVSGNGFPSRTDPTLWMDFADINGDGRLDAITGQGESTPAVNQLYLGNGNQPLDNTAPRIIVEQAPPAMVPEGQTFGLRYAVSDRVVTDGGPRLFRAYAKVTNSANTVELPAHFVGGDLFHVEITATGMAGSQMTVQLCATDRRMNDACGAMQTFNVVVDPAGSGGGGMGGMGAGGMMGTGGTTTTTSSTTSSTTAGVGGMGPATVGAGGSTSPPVGESSGCSCRLDERPSAPGGYGWLLGLGLWLWRRRGGGSGLGVRQPNRSR